MTEEQAVMVVYGCAESVKRAIGQEKTVGLFIGCAIGEILLTGGSREDLDKFIDQAWAEFIREQKEARGG